MLALHVLWNSFLQELPLTGSLHNSCSEQFFGKLLSVLKKDSDMEALLGSFPKPFRAAFFFFKKLMYECF